MKSLEVSRDGHVATLSLNRPEAHNALNEELLTALTSTLDEFRHDDGVRVVVLTGANEVFCAGADITAFDQIRAEGLIGPRKEVGGTIWSDLGRFPKPIIAAVEGLALGGGCELALACDTVVAGASAKFGVPEVKLGVIPGGGGTQRLVNALGRAKAMALLLTGDFIEADEACASGLVARVVPKGDSLAQATAMAQRIAANSPLAVGLAKDAALAALEISLSAGLEHEKRNFHVAIHSEDSREGQAAFLAKRTPTYSGK